MLVGAVWLLSLTQTIVIPVVTAAILASVLAPLVRRLKRPRRAARRRHAIVLLLIVVAGAALAWLVIRGISAQSSELNSQLQGAATKVEGWLKDLGVNSQTAANAKQDASGSISNAFHFLLKGLGTGLKELGSLAVFLSFTILSLFFLLKDGPMIRSWLERHMGVPHPVARTISTRTIGSMQGYFVGVTAVAAFNGIVIGLGALVLGVPLAGSIAVINFVAAYIPYLGAWTAGAFTVLVALGDGGPVDGAGDGRHHPARQRGAAAAHPADRLRGGAGHPPARRPDRHDRRRRAVRDDRADRRRSAHVGRGQDRRRSRRRPRRGRAGAAAVAGARDRDLMSTDDVLLGLGLVLVLAVAAQLAARLTRLPAIVVLLPAGFAAGAITDVVHPDRLLGDLYQPFVSIAVGVILFEAGLRLSFGAIAPDARRLVVQLVTIGVLVTWLAVAARRRW